MREGNYTEKSRVFCARDHDRVRDGGSPERLAGRPELQQHIHGLLSGVTRLTENPCQPRERWSWQRWGKGPAYSPDSGK